MRADFLEIWRARDSITQDKQIEKAEQIDKEYQALYQKLESLKSPEVVPILHKTLQRSYEVAKQNAEMLKVAYTEEF